MVPSLVTCPTSTVAMPRCLATAISAAATARICGTPPAPPSTASVEMVCTESTTSRPGPTASRWVSTAPRSFSAARNSLVVHGADALGAQAHLGGGLLAGDDQRAAAAGGEAVGDVEQQGRLAHARLTGEQHHRARAPARRRAPGPARRRRSAGPGPGRGRARRSAAPRCSTGAGADRAALPRADLGDRAPRLALRATAHPAQRLGAALRAAVGGPGGARAGGSGHAAHARRELRQNRRGSPGRPPAGGWVSRSGARSWPAASGCSPRSTAAPGRAASSARPWRR